VTNEKFEMLARRVFLTMLANPNQDTCNSKLPAEAVALTDMFVNALYQRHIELASKTSTLTPEEIKLLHSKPHPEVIRAIKLVRDRTGLSLVDAKHLVDTARRDLGLL
jgi:ribosomal protein L7/L12